MIKENTAIITTVAFRHSGKPKSFFETTLHDSLKRAFTKQDATYSIGDVLVTEDGIKLKIENISLRCLPETYENKFGFNSAYGTDGQESEHNPYNFFVTVEVSEV